MRKSSRISAWFLLSSALLLATPSVAITPDWVRQAAASTLPTYDAETNAVVLLDEANVRVLSPSEYVEHFRRVVKILRPEGRDEADVVVYLEGNEKLHSIHCWSLDRSGKEFELKDKDFSEGGVFFGFDLYNDVRKRTGRCPAADPGSVIAFEYDVQRHSWVNEFEWGFQESIPVHQSHVSLTLPPGWEYKAQWANGEPVEPSKIGDGGWEWTLRDLPAIEHEPMRPSTWALSLRMGLIYFPSAPDESNAGSWKALGRWYTQLTSDRRMPSPEISQKARELTVAKTDFDARARALASFLQTEVRYVAVEIGIGGFQPHPAIDVFRARYGDCKDKATLLSTMLHEVGIESNYVLINTNRGLVNPALSSPHFNHAILAVELPAGTPTDRYQSIVTSKNGKQYLIFDPTDPYTPMGALRGDLQDTYALLVTTDGGELIHTPLAQPEANELSRTGHFTVAADGTISGEIVEIRSGDHAVNERASLIHANQQERTDQIERRLNRSLKGFTLETVDVRQLDQTDKNLDIMLKLTNPGYAQIRGPLMLLRPRVIGEKSLALDRKPRHFPFQWENASRETDVFEFELPKEYSVDDLPEPVNVDMGFAAYHSKFEVAGKKLRYSREFIRREVLLPPQRTEELRKMQGIIGADENAAVVLKRNS
jgi:Domain of Unknown Function with PDB structure (DUF3857)/Transglutaminase-like superfamily